MNLGETIEQAKEQLEQLTGLKPISVTMAYQVNDDEWLVSIDMLEMKRLPSDKDIVSDYKALLNTDGVVVRFERCRIRVRGEPIVMSTDGKVCAVTGIFALPQNS